MRRFLNGAAMVLALLLGLGLGPVAFQPPPAWARQSMSFSPGDRSRAHYGSRSRTTRHYGSGRPHGRATHHGRGRPHGPARPATRSPSRGGGDEGAAAQAVPGKGFSLENGVLTYPAPARFQPQNLRHR